MNDEERARYKAAFRLEFEAGFRQRLAQIERELRDAGRPMTRLEVLDLCEQRIPALSDVLARRMGIDIVAMREELELRKEVLRELIAELRRPLIN